MATSQVRLDNLAEDLTRALSIPFKAVRERIAFREPLRVTDWSIPLLFDGHCRLDGTDLIPTSFVGHALWAGLRAKVAEGETRPWWQCVLTPAAAAAIVASVDEDEDWDESGSGLDVTGLLEDIDTGDELAAVAEIRIAS